MAGVPSAIFKDSTKEAIETIALFILNFTYEIDPSAETPAPSESEIAKSEKQLIKDIAVMIRNGHVDVLDYSISFFYIALKEIYSSQKDQFRAMAIASRSAGVSQEDFESFMAELSEDTDKEEVDINDNLRNLTGKGL